MAPKHLISFWNLQLTAEFRRYSAAPTGMEVVS